MKGMNTNAYGIGVFLTLLGGAGLAEISTSNHGSFAICVTMFSIGFAICVNEFLRK